MAHKPPPVPPAERSPKGGSNEDVRGKSQSKTDAVPENLSEQDRQGNIHQNTRNQGYQQDR